MIFCVLCNKQPFYNTNTCIIFGCKYSPKFNHEGETKLLYCKKHATDDMENMVNTSICVKKLCNKTSIYGFIKTMYCGDHTNAV